MKIIKTYEEFDFTEITNQFLNSPYTYLLGGLYLLQWFGPKIISKIQQKNRYKDMMVGDSYTSGRISIKEEGDVISLLYNTFEHGWKDVARFIINKKEKTFEYISDSYPLKVKLKEKEMGEILSGIDFIKNINETIADCFYDISDNGYEVKLDYVDFYKKTFEIRIDKSKDRMINFSELAPYLEETLHRITSMYGVKVNKKVKISSVWGSSYFHVSEFNDDYVRIENDKSTPITYNFNLDTTVDIYSKDTNIEIQGLFIGFN